jgi:hypothetical protein
METSLGKRDAESISEDRLCDNRSDMKTFFTATLSGVLFLAAASGQAARTQEQEDYMKLMRSDLRKEKSSIVDQAMGLDAAQKAKFWPIYQNYEKELTAIFDKRVATIKKYAESFPNTPDAVADQLVSEALANLSARSDLWKKYHAQMKTALGSKVAARFLQVENTLSQMIDLQLSTEIPLMP